MPGEFVCHLCSSYFISALSLKRHVKQVHEKQNDFSDLECTPSAYKIGKTEVPVGAKNNICHICDLAFSEFSSLENHLVNVHTFKKQYQCGECGKTFQKQFNLKIHIANMHSKVKSYLCDFCTRTFSQKVHLKKHIVRWHKSISPITKKINEYKFECGLCSNSYTLLHSLKIHITDVHENVRLFQCKFCSESFSQKCQLRRHIINNHGIEEKDVEIETPSKQLHKCQNCDKYFADQLDLNKHSATCTRTFSQKVHLQNHIARVHKPISPTPEKINEVSFDAQGNMKYYKCEFCKKSFLQKVYLEIHIKVFHKLENVQQPKFPEIVHDLKPISIQPEKINEKSSEDIVKVKTSNIESPITMNSEIKGNVNKNLDEIQPSKVNEMIHNLKPISTNFGKIKEVSSEVIVVSKTSNIETPITLNTENKIDSDKLQRKKFECGLCCKNYNTLNDLKIHITEMHENVKHLQCKFCPSSFNKFQILEHMTTEHGIEEKHVNFALYKCQGCDKHFAEQLDLFQHFKTCPTLDKKFVPTEKMKKNLNKSKENHECRVCGKTFQRAYNMKVHIERVHKKIRNYNCKLCQKSFSQKAHLQKHISSFHSGEFQYKCGLCSKSYTLLHSLKKMSDFFNVNFVLNPLIKDVYLKTTL